MTPRSFSALGAILFVSTGAASAQQLEVIYSKKWASPTGSVPGALDLSGNPVPGRWRAIEDVNIRPDGTEWIIKGRTDLGSDLETILVRGAGSSGTNFAQEGQPVQGGAAGELYDFFDTPRPASWDTAGNMVLSFRAKNGVANTLEKLVRVVGGTHTVLLQQGTPALGLLDIPANPTGDELFGNSMGGVYALDSGTGAFVNTPITNLSSFRYPATFRGDTAFRQSGVSMIGGETWDTFSLDGHGGTPDGLHWYADGEFEVAPTTTDGIAVVDDVVVLREGSLIGGSGLVFGDVFQMSMAPNGVWYARGRDNSGTAATAPDWFVRSGTVLVKTGDAIGADAWGDTFYAVAGNAAGDWALAGRTTNADPAIDDVLVFNGVVIVREGDPVDLDGNGLFDDDAFVGRGVNTNAAFAANDLFVGSNRVVFAIVQLRNGAGVDINDAAFGTADAFVRITVEPQIFAHCFGDGTGTPCPCGNAGAAGHGCANSQAGSDGAVLAASGTTTPDTLTLTATEMLPNITHIWLQGDARINSGVLFGDGLRCTSGNLLRLAVKVADPAGTAQYPGLGDLSISARSAALGSPIGSRAVRQYQTYYRDPNLAFCPAPPGDSWNVTNAVQVRWD